MKEKEFIKAIKSSKIVSIGPWGFWSGGDDGGYYYESTGAYMCFGKFRDIRSLWNLAKKLLVAVKKAGVAIKIEVDEIMEMDLDLDEAVSKQMNEIINGHVK